MRKEKKWLTLWRGHVPAKSSGGRNKREQLRVITLVNISQILKKTFGGDMSPPKSCVEFVVNGQPFGVPSQHPFCPGTRASPPKAWSPVLCFVVVIPYLNNLDI